MVTSIDEQISKLKQAIAELEAQRAILGDAAVEAALIPSRKKLAALEAQIKLPSQEPREIPGRQRKLVTLLYMDVVGSTAMTQALDPEDTMEIMDKAILRLAAPIEAHGGHVTRYTGDGFKAIFGDPIAREDDPEQAIRAGLETLDISSVLAKEIEQDWGIEGFQVRVGIDTGLAALGGLTEGKDTVKGRVVNLGVRIESAAPPGGLLISHNTYRHVRGVFTVEPQEPIMAKGFPELVPVYLVKEIKPRAFRVQTHGVEGVETRMIGRESELKLLQDALLNAIEAGEGQMVTITGEAGVGKSRLLYEFWNWIDLLPPPHLPFFEGRARQESQSLPYSLLRDLFAFRFQVLDDDSGQEARTKIENGFMEVLGDDENSIMRAHIVGQLLGFDFSDSPHLKGVLNDPEQLRNRAVMYLIQYFQAFSQDTPVVIFLEDLHWADESSLEMINRLGEYTTELPLLILGSARPALFERRPYWGEGLDYHTHLELRPLTKRESRQLVAEILKQAMEVPAELRELVVQGTEGNPFYLEELVKMLIEDGVIIPGEETWRIDLTRLEEVDVPSTLVGVLQARLDGLPAQERTVLQQASVVGRLFWDRIVVYIQAKRGIGDDPQQIPQLLTSLRNRELVYRHEESEFVGAVEYLFKHDVLREVTYESVIKRLRETYHGLVADWLIANSGDRIGEYSGLIAEHLLIAGRDDQACGYFSQAGELALASYANHEAEGYYRKALALSADMSLRADLLAGLGKALNKQGHAREAEQVWMNAKDLYQELEDSNKMGEIYTRLSWLLWYTDDFSKAWKVCREGLKLLEGKPDSKGYARLLGEAGRTALFSNEYDQVVDFCQQSIDMANRLGDQEVNLEASITLAMIYDDAEKSINLLKEVAEKAEAAGWARIAARAHNNIGATMDNQFIDLESSRMHCMRAAEILKRIGYVEGLLFQMINIYFGYINLGELSSVEDEVTKLLKAAFVPENRVREFLNLYRHNLLFYRGEWQSALEIERQYLEEIIEGDSVQRIADAKVAIGYYILELDRFGYNPDLAEAECLFQENIRDNLSLEFSNTGLVMVYIHQGRLEDACAHFSQCKSHFDQTINIRFEKEYIPWMKYEFSLAEGNWHEAVETSESMLKIFQSEGYSYQSARQLINLGDALIGRNEQGDLKRARETYQQSLDMFTEMGAPGYVKVLEERLENLQRL